MFVPTIFLLLSPFLLLTQFTLSVTPSPQSNTHPDNVANQETKRTSTIDKVLSSVNIPSELATIVGEYEGLSTPRLASEVFKSPMTLKSKFTGYGDMYYYTSTENVPQHSTIELGTLAHLTNGLQYNKDLGLEFKVALHNNNRHCYLTDREISMLGIEIRNEKTMQTDRCMNVAHYEPMNKDINIKVSLLPSIATSDWNYSLVLPRLSNCEPDMAFIVSAIYYWYIPCKDPTTQVNSKALLPKNIRFGHLPQQIERPVRVTMPTIPRIPYQEEDLDQLTDARTNVPGRSSVKYLCLGFKGVFPTQTYTKGSMIYLGSMREITSQKRKRNTIDVTVHVQVYDTRDDTKEEEEVEVEALNDVRALAYEAMEKGTRLPTEDWPIQSFNGLALKDQEEEMIDDDFPMDLSLPINQPNGGIQLTKTLGVHSPNAHYWLRLPPLPHGFEYRVTYSMSYRSYVRNGIQSSEWLGKDFEEKDQ